VLLDPDFTGNLTPKLTMRWESASPRQEKSKIKVKPWQNPITTVGFLQPHGRGYSKMAILDRILWIAGSQNWSISGNYLNDETLIAIENPTIAAHYEREFSRFIKQR